MQEIILEEPYEFVPPVESDFWCWLLRLQFNSYMRKSFGVTSFEIRGLDRLKASLKAGSGIVLAANHSRLADPMAIGHLAGQAGTELFTMASWHLFMEGAYQRFLIRRMGAFSVYREGNDRQAVNQAIEILVAGRRPLLIFPEGAVSRHNDLVMELMDGPGFIARQATKRRKKEGKGPVVIHPVAIRYSYEGDPMTAIRDDVEKLEKSLSWQPQSQLPIYRRLAKIGEALLTLKEVEYLGEASHGDSHERADRLVAVMLDRLETKWDGNTTSANKGQASSSRVVRRVKRIRTMILPDLVAKKVTQEEREDRWRDLAICYYLQQIAHYPPGYLTGKDDLPERVIETLERMIEDFRDELSYHAPMHCTLVVGEPIEVSGTRDRSAGGDPAMQRTAESLQAMLDELVAERRTKLFG